MKGGCSASPDTVDLWERAGLLHAAHRGVRRAASDHEPRSTPARLAHLLRDQGGTWLHIVQCELGVLAPGEATLIQLVMEAFGVVARTSANRDSTEHSICGSKGKDEFYAGLGMFTFASTVMALGDEPALHVSFGPPDTAAYRGVSLRELCMEV